MVTALRAELPEAAFAFEYPGGFVHEPGYRSVLDLDPANRIASAEELLAGPEGPTVFKVLAQVSGMDPDEMLRRARAAAGDLAEITRSSPLLEIGAVGVTKATTLARCCAERGRNRARLACSGISPAFAKSSTS